jgi:hypothetical protein
MNRHGDSFVFETKEITVISFLNNPNILKKRRFQENLYLENCSLIDDLNSDDQVSLHNAVLLAKNRKHDSGASLFLGYQKINETKRDLLKKIISLDDNKASAILDFLCKMELL